jgi:hypothetical protein
LARKRPVLIEGRKDALLRGSPDEDLTPALVPRACAALLDAGILNADLLGATNARAASLNAKIQSKRPTATSCSSLPAAPPPAAMAA